MLKSIHILLCLDDRFAVGTTYGGLFIWKLNERIEPDFYAPFCSDSCVKDLHVIDKVRLNIASNVCIE